MGTTPGSSPSRPCAAGCCRLTITRHRFTPACARTHATTACPRKVAEHGCGFHPVTCQQHKSIYKARMPLDVFGLILNAGSWQVKGCTPERVHSYSNLRVASLAAAAAAEVQAVRPQGSLASTDSCCTGGQWLASPAHAVPAVLPVARRRLPAAAAPRPAQAFCRAGLQDRQLKTGGGRGGGSKGREKPRRGRQHAV